MLPSIVGAAQLDAMVKLAESAPDGAIVEVGVFRGGSAHRLYEVAIKQNRELYLFDSFSGTPVHTPGLDKHQMDAEFYDRDAFDNVSRLMPLAHIYRGIYPETHPPSLHGIAFIHCDCDQYLSYRAVIDRMWPLVVQKGILLFDDYPYLEGARIAVDESFDLRLLHKCFQRYYVVKGEEVG